MLDDDTAGRQGATAIAEALMPDMTVAIISTSGGHQPDELGPQEIQRLVNAKQV